MKNQQKATWLALGTVLCWSTIASAFKIALRHATFSQILLTASLTALLFYLLYLILTGKLHTVFRVSFRKILYSALAGFMNPFLYYLILIRAYDILPAQEAMSLNYMWLVMLVLLSIPFLKQKISLLSFAAILVSYAGVIVIATRGDFASLRFSNPEGALLVMLTTVIWALYWILNMKDEREESAKLFSGFFFGTLYILIFNLVTGVPFALHWQAVSSSVYIGLFEMGVPFILWLQALRLSETTARISNLVFFTPALALLLIHIILGEEMYVSTLAGLLLILGGIILQRIFAAKKL